VVRVERGQAEDEPLDVGQVVGLEAQVDFLLQLLGLEVLVELALAGRPGAALVDGDPAVGPVVALSVPWTPDLLVLELQ